MQPTGFSKHGTAGYRSMSTPRCNFPAGSDPAEERTSGEVICPVSGRNSHGRLGFFSRGHNFREEGGDISAPLWEAGSVPDRNALEVTGQESGNVDGGLKAIEPQLFDRHLMLEDPDFGVSKIGECVGEPHYYFQAWPGNRRLLMGKAGDPLAKNCREGDGPPPPPPGPHAKFLLLLRTLCRLGHLESKLTLPSSMGTHDIFLLGLPSTGLIKRSPSNPSSMRI